MTLAVLETAAVAAAALPFRAWCRCSRAGGRRRQNRNHRSRAAHRHPLPPIPSPSHRWAGEGERCRCCRQWTRMTILMMTTEAAAVAAGLSSAAREGVGPCSCWEAGGACPSWEGALHLPLLLRTGTCTVRLAVHNGETARLMSLSSSSVKASIDHPDSGD